jgi:hypothetical protein
MILPSTTLFDAYDFAILANELTVADRTSFLLAQSDIFGVESRAPEAGTGSC